MWFHASIRSGSFWPFSGERRMLIFHTFPEIIMVTFLFISQLQKTSNLRTVDMKYWWTMRSWYWQQTLRWCKWWRSALNPVSMFLNWQPSEEKWNNQLIRSAIVIHMSELKNVTICKSNQNSQWNLWVWLFLFLPDFKGLLKFKVSGGNLTNCWWFSTNLTDA